MTKVAFKMVPLVFLVIVGIAAASLTGTVGFGDLFGDTGNRRGNRINLYASSTGRVPVIVDATVTSNVRGVIYQTRLNEAVNNPPFLKSFMVENGETLTGVLNAGVVYPGRAVVISCAVTADVGNIEGGHDMYTKERSAPLPDVHCRGAVTSPAA